MLTLPMAMFTLMFARLRITENFPDKKLMTYFLLAIPKVSHVRKIPATSHFGNR